MRVFGFHAGSANALMYLSHPGCRSLQSSINTGTSAALASLEPRHAIAVARSAAGRLAAHGDVSNWFLPSISHCAQSGLTGLTALTSMIKLRSSNITLRFGAGNWLEDTSKLK